MTNKVLDLIHNTHGEGKEKAIFVGDLIIKADKSNFYDDLNDTMKFFYKHIPLHFAYEEALINTLLKNNVLAEDEIVCMNKILQEHREMKTNFEHLNAMSLKMDRGVSRSQKEEFLAIVNETVDALIKHAQYEDQFLYPVAGQKCDGNLLSIVEKEMAKIVY
jgi:hemerythrin-like domain-containing protein